ncbi:12604_t:CDS:2 [Entrophospora sp. SA101]|nr:12604_t:CDS:2 [Entrophospora sp. SA101]
MHNNNKSTNPQKIEIIPKFTLRSKHNLYQVPVAYKTWGKLNENKDNVMVICHAFSGSADVEDWWGPLIGKGRAFDPTKFFIFCANVLGSPYGTASPLTINPETGKPYGPEFPLTTINDDVRLHKMVLDSLGVKQIAICIGGSMGGMQVLEWSFFGPEYVKIIVPIATSARHSAWCISWGEAQRQSIYSDPKYRDGFYDPDEPPTTGLAAARMAALLTYRSRNSFESRFGRNYHDPTKFPAANTTTSSPKIKPSTLSGQALLIHNDGHRSEKILNGDKFVKRFDANCYINITRKMDTHDIAYGKHGKMEDILNSIKQPTLVIGIKSDGLFTISEQYELADHIPNAEMITIESPDGHDGFLLEFDQMNKHILNFIKKHLSTIYKDGGEQEEENSTIASGEIITTKNGLFDEAEVEDILKCCAVSAVGVDHPDQDTYFDGVLGQIKIKIGSKLNHSHGVPDFLNQGYELRPL